MKKILMLSILSLFGALSANAAEPSFVCKILADNHQSAKANECLGEIKGNHFWSPDAVNVCVSIAQNHQYSQAVSCLTAVRNKDFPSGSVAVCQQSANNHQYANAVKCLETVGYDYPNSQPSRCNIRKLRNQVDGAIANFYSGNSHAVINTLMGMKNELDRCE